MFKRIRALFFRYNFNRKWSKTLQRLYRSDYAGSAKSDELNGYFIGEYIASGNIFSQLNYIRDVSHLWQPMQRHMLSIGTHGGPYGNLMIKASLIEVLGTEYTIIELPNKTMLAISNHQRDFEIMRAGNQRSIIIYDLSHSTKLLAKVTKYGLRTKIHIESLLPE